LRKKRILCVVVVGEVVVGSSAKKDEVVAEADISVAVPKIEVFGLGHNVSAREGLNFFGLLWIKKLLKVVMLKNKADFAGHELPLMNFEHFVDGFSVSNEVLSLLSFGPQATCPVQDFNILQWFESQLPSIAVGIFIENIVDGVVFFGVFKGEVGLGQRFSQSAFSNLLNLRFCHFQTNLIIFFCSLDLFVDQINQVIKQN